jgi:hypothetical protein
VHPAICGSDNVVQTNLKTFKNPNKKALSKPLTSFFKYPTIVTAKHTKL